MLWRRRCEYAAAAAHVVSFLEDHWVDKADTHPGLRIRWQVLRQDWRCYQGQHNYAARRSFNGKRHPCSKRHPCNRLTMESAILVTD